MTVTVELDAASKDSRLKSTLTQISLSISKSKKIVVLTGAGISCSCGIPDFRSSDGLYSLVKERYPDVVLKGRDLFDASLFRDPTSTSVFFTFISQLKRSIDAAEPTPTHHFIKTLDSKKKLLRSYTQNIDGLEARVGLLGSSCHEAKSNGKGKGKIRAKDVRNVQLHGDIHRVRCVACSADFPCDDKYLSIFEQGSAPDCPECLTRSEARIARSARAIRVGSLRPGIVLYDETHPLGDDIGDIHSADLTKKPDMLIIMGTSLKVHGFKKLVKDFARMIHSSPSLASANKKPFKVIFVNKTAPGSEWSDIIDCHISGETDRWSNIVIEDWKKHKPADWETQQSLVAGDDQSMIGAFKTVKISTLPASKDSKTRKDKEKAAVPHNEVVAKPTIAKENLVAPSSPSKRRQKSSHYDDVNSSPSKRQSRSQHHPVMPPEERKLLFAVTTNTQKDVCPDARDRSAMDISLGEMTLQDSEGRGTVSKMDMSILELSMRDEAPSPAKNPAPVKSRGTRQRTGGRKKELVFVR